MIILNTNKIKPLKSKYNCLAITFFIVCLGCGSTKLSTQATDNLPATALKPFGRYIINKEQNLELISSAVHLGFSFEGTECRVYASHAWKGGHNYLQYELDGAYQKRIRIEGNDTMPLIITAQKSGKHTVWIYKATEAHTGAIIIKKVTGKNINT